SIALSTDGSTALISAPFDSGGKGAAWWYTRSGGVWSQQGPKFTGALAFGNAWFGYSVALSADGTTALIGGTQDSVNPGGGGAAGAAWFFTNSGSGWSQQAKLTEAVRSSSDGFGDSVALSADGNTALIGAPAYGGNVGGAWFFVRTGGNWGQQGPIIQTS